MVDVDLIVRIENCDDLEQLADIIQEASTTQALAKTILPWLIKSKLAELIKSSKVLPATINLPPELNDEAQQILNKSKLDQIRSKYRLSGKPSLLLEELERLDYSQRTIAAGELANLPIWTAAEQIALSNMQCDRSYYAKVSLSPSSSSSPSSSQLESYLVDRMYVQSPISLRDEVMDRRGNPLLLKQRINRIMQLMIRRREGGAVDMSTFKELSRYEEFVNSTQDFDALESFCFEQLAEASSAALC